MKPNGELFIVAHIDADEMTIHYDFTADPVFANTTTFEFLPTSLALNAGDGSF